MSRGKTSLKMHSPHLEGEYCLDNTVPFDNVPFSSNKPVWWICSVGHRWQTPPALRTRKAKYPSRCPYCSGRRISEVNSLRTKAPHLESEYHPDNLVPFEDVSFGSTKKVKWRCSQCSEHVWEMAPNSRTSQEQGCPYCSGTHVSSANSLKTRAPHLEVEYHPSNPLPFEEVGYGSKVSVLWQCLKNPQHTWPALPNSRTSSESGCPHCPQNFLTDKNSLEVRAPWLAKEYHPDNPIPFAEMTFGSRKGVVWICSKNSNHTWVATPNSRTYSKTGCPHCSFQHSKAELAIFAAVKEKRPDALNGKRGELKSKLLELDVFVPSLRKAIEYDGTYYHPVGQERDVRKNQQCIEAGISLLRVLEAEYEADPAAALLKIFQWLALPPPTD